MVRSLPGAEARRRQADHQRRLRGHEEFDVDFDSQKDVLQKLIDPAIMESGGRIVKTMGDGLAFWSASREAFEKSLQVFKRPR
ncbi:hypothetical protein ASD00_37765 [Ensifer sp. Root31]|nr:hypothetical protein ASD00_37765 [Ensifer sp. Root31]KQW61418.1 hypothetical protein ASD03_36615 [Ensifer sp. Root127]